MLYGEPAEADASIEVLQKLVALKASAPWYSEGFSQVLHVLRSFSLFFALEAVAWFLLRQYRLAINDYKELYRTYLRRQSFYLAQTLLFEHKDSASASIVAIPLMQSETFERLAVGETTPDLEAQKLAAQNPIFAIWQGYLEKLPMASKGP